MNGPALCCLLWRTNGLECGDGLGQARCAGEVQCRDDRRESGCDCQSRRTREVQSRDGEDRLGSVQRVVVRTLEAAREALPKVGLPCVVRPSFTLGGSGSAIAYNRDEFDALIRNGLTQSPISEILLEESIIGWKEYEMEVMRDLDDNVVIICSIENFDPMGVHTGDSITVAPAQTLTDKEYQRMRDASLAVIREIGVETGGSNIQFAIHPQTGRMIVIEMNPRVVVPARWPVKPPGFPSPRLLPSWP